MSDMITVGTVARRGGVNLQTVLYYERRSLLAPVRRTDSGYRLYSPEAVRVIRFIKNSQRLGFSLAEISRLLKLRVGRRAQCAGVRRQAQTRLKVVEEKIAALRGMKRSLNRLIGNCSRRAMTAPCPILESLEDVGRPNVQ